MSSKKFTLLSIISISIIFLVSFLILAWTGPTQSPPLGNIEAPINVSTTTQTKKGGLNIMENLGVGTENPLTKLHVVGGYIRSDTGFCIGGNCINAWPSSEITGGGTINYLPKWSGNTSLTNSSLYEDSSYLNVTKYLNLQNQLCFKRDCGGDRQTIMKLSGNPQWVSLSTLASYLSSYVSKGTLDCYSSSRSGTDWAIASCASGYVASGGGCALRDDLGAQTLISKPSGSTSWYCDDNGTAGTAVTAYVVCCRIK